jgi:sugar lactone lactonase YvrE
MELITDIRAALGEGPSWDGNRQVLYWVDILGKRFYEFNPSDGKLNEYQSDQLLGAVVPRQSGGFILAMQHGLYSFRPETNEWLSIHDPEAHKLDNRFNDGKCDPSGRFWTGTLSMTGKSQDCALYRMDPDLSVTKVMEGISLSNGMGWSPEGTTMYFIDTPTYSVAAFDYDLASGSISGKRLLIDIPRNAGAPDGMTVDEEGMLWIAHWGGYQVTRWNPRTGTMLQSLSVPAPHVTSCVFGGKNRNELYITTARESLSEDLLHQYPLSGGLFRVKLDICGAESYSFIG